MKPDPIVEEIHETRRKLWEECGGDLDKLIRYYRTAQEEYRDRIVTREEFLHRKERARNPVG